MVEKINLPNHVNQDRIALALENIASGNSKAEVDMARVDTEGITHSTLKERIDNDITILDGKIVGIENGWSAWIIEGNLVPNTSLIFGEIPAQNYVDKTIAVTGCDIDNLAVVNPKTPLTAGLVWNAFIVAPNIVTIRVSNITSAPITDSGRNWVVKVI